MTRPTPAQILTELPELVALLPLVRIGSTGDPNRSSRPVPGPRPPVRLEVVHILDTRTRATGDDATVRYEDDQLWVSETETITDHRQGILPDLWLWARMIEAEMLESSPTLPAALPDEATMVSVCSWLTAHTAWAEQQRWGVEYVRDLRHWHKRVKAVLGLRGTRQMRHDCTACGNPAALVNAGDVWACPECGHEDPGPRAQIRDYRFQDSRPTDTICAVFRVTPEWLRKQKQRRRLAADTSKGERPLHWWPWDVFRLLHPGIVESYERHEQEAVQEAPEALS